MTLITSPAKPIKSMIKLMFSKGQTANKIVQRGYSAKLVYACRQEYLDAHGLIKCSELAEVLGVSRVALWTAANRRNLGRVMGSQLIFNEAECEVLTHLYTIPADYVPLKKLGCQQLVWSWFHKQYPEHKHHLKWCVTPNQAGGWYVSPEGQKLFKNRNKKPTAEEIAITRQRIIAMRSKGIHTRDIAKALGCSEAKIFWHLRRMKKEAL